MNNPLSRLGFSGISEGVILFSVNRTKQVIIANCVVGGLSFLFFVGRYVGMWGGPITVLVIGVKAPVTELGILNSTIPGMFGGAAGGQEFISILWFFVSIAAASFFHVGILIMMMRGSVKKQFADALTKLNH